MPGTFRGVSAGPSSGQDFKRHGKAGNTYAFAAADIQAMSGRLIVTTMKAARQAADIIEEEVIKYLTNFKYDEGRLAATIGTWKPWLIKHPDVLAQAQNWAEENDVNQPPQVTNDIDESIEYGALRSIRHYRGDSFSVEVGTFTPYAGLVEDGGSMPIHPFGKRNVTITAKWYAHNMFSKGMFDSFNAIEKALEESTNEALNGS